MEKYVDLVKVIQNNFSKLSKGQKLIAEFITNEYDKAAFMTAAELGNIVKVSESTVVRFASTLGYSGYKELQKELQLLIRNKLTTVQRLGLTDEFSTENSLKKVMEKDMENIEKTINEINNDTFNKAVELILKGKKIYILGLRSSSFLAGYLGFYLNFILEDVNVVTSGANDVFEQLLKSGEEDVIIGISYPRYSKRTLEALEYGKEKGSTIISITDNLMSPAALSSDVTLIASSNMVSFVDSLVAPMSLINAIIVAIAMEKKEDVTIYFENLENIWNKYNVYDLNNKDNDLNNKDND